MVAPARHPAADDDAGADVAAAELTGQMRAHHSAVLAVQPEPAHQLISRHIHLRTGGQVLHGDGIACRLLAHRASRRTPHPNGRPPSTAPSPTGRHTHDRRATRTRAALRASRPLRNRRSPSITNTSRRSRSSIASTPRRVGGEQEPLDADPEPDAGCRRAAHVLRELVVAAAAAERVLRGIERVARELERGARVVVEAAHEPGRQLVGDAERVEAAAARPRSARASRHPGTR